MARLSPTYANTGLDAILVPSTSYNLALFTTDPGTTGSGTEFSTGGYARQTIQFASASAGSKASNTAQTFTNIQQGSFNAPVYFGIFTTGGTYIAGGQCNGGANVAISPGSTISVASGAITFSLA